MEIDRTSFARSPVFFGRTLCPVCSAEHEWFARDAWIEEGPDGTRTEQGGRRIHPEERRGRAPASPLLQARTSPGDTSILQLNIQRYRALLQTESDTIKLNMIRSLLAEEEQALSRVSFPAI